MKSAGYEKYMRDSLLSAEVTPAVRYIRCSLICLFVGRGGARGRRDIHWVGEGELQRDTMFYLNTSLRSSSRPMGVLDGSCLHLIWEATDSFLFLSPMETDVKDLFRFPPVAIL